MVDLILVRDFISSKFVIPLPAYTVIQVWVALLFLLLHTLSTIAYIYILKVTVMVLSSKLFTNGRFVKNSGILIEKLINR